VEQSPDAGLGQDVSVCEGTAVILDPAVSGPGFSYAWNTGSTDSVLNVSSSGVYSVAISNGGNCTGRDTVTVEINVQPSGPQIVGDLSYCEGETLILSSGAPANINASWTGPNGFSFTGASLNVPGLSAGQSGSYKVFLFSGGCLGPEDSVQVTVSPNPSLELGPDTAACSGTPIILGVPAQPGLSYQWTGGATTSTISVSGSGLFFLTIQNQANCSVRDSIQVSILPNPLPVEILNGSGSICANQSVWLKVRGRSAEQYLWTGPNGFSAVADSVLAGNGSFGNFTVQARRENCIGPVSDILLTAKALPQLAVSHAPVVCKGNTTEASVQTSPGANLLWSNFTSETQTRLSVGRHWVSASLNGCSVSDTFTIANSGPTAAFITNPADSLLEVYQEVNYLDRSLAGLNPLASWNWSLGFARQSSSQNPKINYQIESEVDIRLIVSDEAGCSDTLTKTFIIGPPSGWFIPNLFTPNNDGDNDLFVIGNLDKYPGTSLRIVNRWGREEAEISDYKNDWTGAGLEDGVYFYTIRRSDGQEFSGYIELKR